jgi:hypothetical protein
MKGDIGIDGRIILKWNLKIERGGCGTNLAGSQ